MIKTVPARRITGEQSRVARIVVYARGHEPRALHFGGRRLDIGRLPVNGIRVDDPRLSGAHARIQRRRDDGVLEVIDRGSSNGTFLNGSRVEQAPLDRQAVLRMGDTVLVVEDGPLPEIDIPPTRSAFAQWLGRQIEAVSQSASPVLLLGPTGAGKGYVARQIAKSSTRGEPFVHVNCAALPPDLVESELFGHVRGAFTGATTDKKGLLEAADGGTLFLDEIGAISPHLQAKLLTAIDERVVRPVGSTRQTRVDLRVLTATNLDIDTAISDGTFRKDLFFRLAARTIQLPPLVDRKADIVPLLLGDLEPADHRALTTEALEVVLCHSWPGNIRELLNFKEQLVTWVDRPIDYQAFPADWTRFVKERARPPAPSTRSQAPSKAFLKAELEAVGWNVSELARRLGKHRNQVVRWLDVHDLRKPPSRAAEPD